MPSHEIVWKNFLPVYKKLKEARDAVQADALDAILFGSEERVMDRKEKREAIDAIISLFPTGFVAFAEKQPKLAKLKQLREEVKALEDELKS